MGIVVLLLIGLVGVGWLALYVRSNGQHEKPLLPPRERPSQPPVEIPPPTRETHVYVPQVEDGDVRFQDVLRTVPEGEDPKIFAVTQFLDESNLAPGGTKLLSVKMKGHTAELNFNDTLRQGAWGSMAGSTLLKGFQMSLGQFDDVNELQILIEGQRVETLDGHFETYDPLPVIRKTP